MEFKEYVTKHLKGAAFFIGGFIIILSSIVISALSPDYSFLSWIITIIGLICLVYGIYLIHKLKYERESSGQRVYHYKGRY